MSAELENVFGSMLVGKVCKIAPMCKMLLVLKFLLKFCIALFRLNVFVLQYFEGKKGNIETLVI